MIEKAQENIYGNLRYLRLYTRICPSCRETLKAQKCDGYWLCGNCGYEEAYPLTTVWAVCLCCNKRLTLREEKCCEVKE